MRIHSTSEFRLQKIRVEVEQPASRTQHAVGHPQTEEQHNEDNEEEQGVEKTKDTTENNNNAVSYTHLTLPTKRIV